MILWLFLSDKKEIHRFSNEKYSLQNWKMKHCLNQKEAFSFCFQCKSIWPSKVYVHQVASKHLYYPLSIHQIACDGILRLSFRQKMNFLIFEWEITLSVFNWAEFTRWGAQCAATHASKQYSHDLEAHSRTRTCKSRFRKRFSKTWKRPPCLITMLGNHKFSKAI